MGAAARQRGDRLIRQQIDEYLASRQRGEIIRTVVVQDENDSIHPPKEQSKMRTYTILATIRFNGTTRTVRAFVQSDSRESAVRDYKRNSLYEARCFKSITATPGKIEAGIKHEFNAELGEWVPVK